ncbi:MAG: DUF4397 domain-containing protein, partial [Ignavibacteriae bacterium]|nr:DUF4397 domain-containing protein [Ignavibacteriota bacterium]
MSLKKLFLPTILLMLAGVVGACVDIPSGPGTNVNPDFRSQVRFIHAIPGGAAGDVVVDGAVVAAGLAFGANTTYYNLAAGSRNIAFGGGGAQTISLGSEQQSTLVIYATATAGGIGYINLIEGHQDKNNGKAGKAKVKFVNVAQGSAENLTFRSDSVTGPSVSGDVGFGASLQYIEFEPGSYTFVVVSPATYKATVDASQEVPPVNDPLSTGTATIRVRPDSGFVYT